MVLSSYSLCRAFLLQLIAIGVVFNMTGAARAEPAALPGWELTWQDEFEGDALDAEKWEVLTRKKNHNRELQYYLPEHVAVADGHLVITATDEPFDGKNYRSGRVFSWFTQPYGRFEARAKVPTTKGIWPAIWMLPRGVKWPSGGEIDIMEHKGSAPNRIGSAYHYATDRGNHTFQSGWHKPEPAVNYPDGFHTYAVEWDPGQIRFFVDGVNHFTMKGLYVSEQPMGVLINTAVGGWYDGNPDETTVFPQTFHIDYVRIYRRTGPAAKVTPLETIDSGLIVNGSFEMGTVPWVFEDKAQQVAHRVTSKPVVLAYEENNGHAIRMLGPSRISQVVPAITPGETYRLTAHVRVNADSPIREKQIKQHLTLEFLDAQGELIEGDANRVVSADAQTAEDQWIPISLTATAPGGAVAARVGLETLSPADEKGAIWIDAVSMHALPDTAEGENGPEATAR